MIVHPINDWILVELLPVEYQVGSIFLPDGVLTQKAIVLESGPGKTRPDGALVPTGVKVGDHVAFSRAHGSHQQGKQIRRELGDNRLLVKPEDIMFVYEGDILIGA